MRIIKLAMVALFAFSAMVGSASAFEPLFLTESRKELLFSGLGVNPILRADSGALIGTIQCEKALFDGFSLPKSTLAHRVTAIFEGKCKQKAGSTETNCTEPITTKQMLAELGLILGNKTVGILLAPSDGAIVFTSVTCGTSTIVEGAVIGEIPALNAKLETQYNNFRSEIEGVFEAENKNSEKQKVTQINLLEVTHPGELKVEGFFGGPASEEVTVALKGVGGIEICTQAPQNCPH